MFEGLPDEQAVRRGGDRSRVGRGRSGRGGPGGRSARGVWVSTASGGPRALWLPWTSGPRHTTARATSAGRQGSVADAMSVGPTHPSGDRVLVTRSSASASSYHPAHYRMSTGFVAPMIGAARTSTRRTRVRITARPGALDPMVTPHPLSASPRRGEGFPGDRMGALRPSGNPGCQRRALARKARRAAVGSGSIGRRPGDPGRGRESGAGALRGERPLALHHLIATALAAGAAAGRIRRASPPGRR